MKLLLCGAVFSVAVAILSMVAFAQTTPQTQTATTQQEQQVTVVGCVQREADYRRARNAGRGGVAGTVRATAGTCATQ